MTEADWRVQAQSWLPALVDRGLMQATWPAIDVHRDYVTTQLKAGVTVSTMHQRLVDEHGLETSVASLRRWVGGNLPEEVRRAQVRVLRPGPVEPGSDTTRTPCCSSLRPPWRKRRPCRAGLSRTRRLSPFDEPRAVPKVTDTKVRLRVPLGVACGRTAYTPARVVTCPTIGASVNRRGISAIRVPTPGRPLPQFRWLAGSSGPA